jgi:hypothetical protein
MAGHRSDRTVTRLAPARPPPPCFERPQSRQCPQFHHPPACERRPYPCSFPAKAKNPCLSPPRQATSPSRSLYARFALCRCASMSHRVKSSRPPPSCSWDLPSSRAPPRATIHHKECPEASRHRLLLRRGCLVDDHLLQSSPGPANFSTSTTPPRSTSASIPALASATPLAPHSQAPPPNHHLYGETLSSEPLPSPLPPNGFIACRSSSRPPPRPTSSPACQKSVGVATAMVSHVPCFGKCATSPRGPAQFGLAS